MTEVLAMKDIIENQWKLIRSLHAGHLIKSAAACQGSLSLLSSEYNPLRVYFETFKDGRPVLFHMISKSTNVAEFKGNKLCRRRHELAEKLSNLI